MALNELAHSHTDIDYAERVLSHFSADGASVLPRSGSTVTPLPIPERAKPQSTRNNAVESREELVSRADRLEHILDVMPNGVVVVDGKGVVRQANQMATDFLGEPLEGELWRTIITRSFAPKADDGHEVSLKDGRRVKLAITPLANEPGQLIVMTDLTETRQLQSRISHMQRLSSLGNMVASLAHQIRTPLSAALLYAANLSNGNMPDKARMSFSEKLVSRLRDLEMQVNDMLLFAKSGEQQVVEPVSMQALLTEVEAGAEAMLSRHEAELSVALPEPDVAVLGNKTALAGALQNLIHNAVQIIQSGAQIQISATRVSKDLVDISVVDNGPGIPEEKLSQIFEPFYTTRSQGTGLGLAVVSSVAKSHQGKVKVTNLEQGGAMFTMRLPVYSRDAEFTSTTVPQTTGALS